jgi:hypothetical protein
MLSSVLLHHVALVRSDASEELITSIIREIVTANVPSSPILVTLMMEVIHSPETSILTRATRCNILENGTLQGNKIGSLSFFREIEIM